jgi:hypothetical protein
VPEFQSEARTVRGAHSLNSPLLSERDAISGQCGRTEQTLRTWRRWFVPTGRQAYIMVALHVPVILRQRGLPGFLAVALVVSIIASRDHPLTARDRKYSPFLGQHCSHGIKRRFYKMGLYRVVCSLWFCRTLGDDIVCASLVSQHCLFCAVSFVQKWGW